MKYLGFIVIFIFQIIGEAVVRFFYLQLPGAVLGMFLLFITLFFFPKLYDIVQFSSHTLLKYLSLFFVPAGIGIMTLFSSIKAELPALIAVVIISTLITLFLCAYIFYFSRKLRVDR